MVRALATILLASFLLPTGAEDMPTLNWVGRKDAVRADKDVVMKILREYVCFDGVCEFRNVTIRKYKYLRLL